MFRLLQLEESGKEVDGNEDSDCEAQNDRFLWTQPICKEQCEPLQVKSYSYTKAI